MNDQFQHGGDGFRYAPEVLDFSANISPLGLPQSVQTALSDALKTFSQYPDPACGALRDAIAAREQVSAEWVHCGNGGAELIFQLAQARKPARAMVLAPTFSEYARALESVGCAVSYFEMHEKDGFAPTEKLLGRLDPALDMLFLCNPNNPTGGIIAPELMERVLKKCAASEIFVVVDECFMPFVENPAAYSVKEKLGAYPNLVVLQAFTKLYAMAGLRLGYLLCANAVTHKRLSACTPAWNVSAPAQTAGIAALADDEYPKQVIALVEQERKFLTEAIGALGCSVIGSQANYIFFKCDSCRSLKEKILEQGVLIRSCANYRGLDSRFYRVAVKTRAENEKLLQAMRATLKPEET